MQKQLVVKPESATFAKMPYGVHFGEVACPFCDSIVKICAPKKGGIAWAVDNCRHSHGAIAGHGNDITVSFKN